MNLSNRYDCLNKIIKDENIDITILGLKHGKMKGLGSTTSYLVTNP